MSVRWGPFTLEKRLALGGMAEIFLATRAGSGGFSKQFALKLIAPALAAEAEIVRMFIEEAQLVAGMVHPNIAQVYELGVVEDRHYIVMEYVAGIDLAALLKALKAAKESVPIGAALAIINGLLQGLAFAHDRCDDSGNPLRLVHRDVSPHNLLLSVDGAIKLTDFGIAKASTSAHKTRTGVIKGKLAYISPEQALGQALDQRSDLFAAGLILQELLSGARVYDDDNDLVLLQRASRAEVSPLPAAVPAALREVVQKALRLDREARFATATDFSNAMQSATREPAWAVARVGEWVRPFAVAPEHLPDVDPASASKAPYEITLHDKPKTERRRRPLGVVALLAAAAAGAWFVSLRREPAVIVAAAPAPASQPSSAPVLPPTRAAPEAFGFLSINSRPWAWVSIDGSREKQMTPVRQLKISPGRHRLLLSNPALEHSVQRSVDIVAGESATVLVEMPR